MNVRLRAVVLCLAVLATAQAEVTVRDGGYHDLVVSFSSNVDAENGKTMVESLELLFTETSEVLHKAIGLRIAGVTFHLPSTWDTSTWEGKTLEHASVLPEDQRDVVVDGTEDSAFGKLPSALQYGGCGVPARRLTVPVDFLYATEENGLKGKLLAREWLKFRYGVFDENGFDGDDMYPLYYNIPGTTEARITECTDPEVEYDFRDTEGNNCSLELPFSSPANCTIHPKEVALNTTSSLMYFHKELTNMESVCGENHTHKDSTPSKQNVLCGGRSIWDILKLSGDFNEAKREEQSENEGIQFSYRQEMKPRVVLAFEDSDNLHDEGDMVLFAIRRFLHFLPDGSEFGLLSFNEKPTELRALSQLAANRDIDIPSAFAFDIAVCSACALKKAAEALSKQPQAQSSVILITASNSTDIEGGLIDQYKALNVCLKIVAFRSEGNPVAGYEELISSSNCNSIEVIEKELTQSQQPYLILELLYRSLRESVTQSPTDTKISEIKSGIMSHNSSLSIDMHSTAAKYTLWTSKLRPLNEIQCTSGGKHLTLAFSGVQTSNIASYNFDPVDGPEVSCKLSFPKLPKVFAQLEMTSKPGEYFDGEIWVHDPSTSSEEQMPVVIYAKINYGGYPVQNAKVKAEVIRGGNVKELELLDNGRGNPDITQHDGIYSRHFVDFSDEGEYKVIVIATDDAANAKVGKKGQDPCCGSQVKSIPGQANFFTKSLETSFWATRKPEIGYKPSTIFDLRVANYDPQNHIVLNWTAPGGEADNGNATSYEFFVFCKSEDCKENGELPEWIAFNNSIPTPSMSGMEDVAVLLFNRGAPSNETVSFCLKAVNLNGQISDISNLVNVKLGESSQPPTVVDPVDKGISKATIRAIVGGSVLGLFVLIGVAFVAHNSAKKIRGPRSRDIPKSECINLGFSDSTKNIVTRNGSPKKNDTRNGSSEKSGTGDDSPMENTTNSSSQINDSRNGSPKKSETFPVVLYTHDQIKHIKETTKTPPLYGANVGPKPWLSLDSLSRRLNRGEDNRSEDSASTLPADGTDYSAEEVKQTDDSSHTNELPLEKIAKF